MRKPATMSQMPTADAIFKNDTVGTGPLLQARGLGFSYAGSPRSVLRDVHLDILPGQTTAVLGGNGSGKTTLGYLLSGIAPGFIRGEMQGSVSVPGSDQIGQTVVYVSQDPEDQIISLTVREEILLGYGAGTADAHRASDRVESLASAMGLLECLDRHPSELSIGQKQRTVLCAALVSGVRVLILDEPFANLDASGCRELNRLLKELRESGSAIVLLLHTLDRVADLADEALYLRDGRLSHDADAVHSESPSGRRDSVIQLPANRFSTAASDWLMAVQSVSYRYPGTDDHAVRDISFELHPGEVIGIAGCNGCGKSTLLRMIAALLKPTQGECRFNDADVRDLDYRQLADVVGLVFQNPNYQIFATSILDEVSFGLRHAGIAQDEQAERIDLVSRVLPGIDLKTDPGKLSYGQRKLLTVACVLAANPLIFLLDEPELGLDSQHSLWFRDLVGTLRRLRRGVVISSHDTGILRECCDRVLFMDHGKMLALGPSAEVCQQIAQSFAEQVALDQ